MLKITYPYPPAAAQPNSRANRHDKARAVAAYREACHWYTKQATRCLRWKDEGPIYYALTLHPPKHKNGRRPDDDNAAGAFKNGRDGVADALGVNDARFKMLRPVVLAESRIHPEVVLELWTPEEVAHVPVQ